MTDLAYQTALAINIASGAHLNQKDKGDNAYILHPLTIMFNLRTSDQELMQIAVLHDVVEDSDFTIEKLREIGFTERVLSALKLMTKDEGMDYTSYITRGLANRDFCLVKRQDILHNSDFTRLKGLRAKDFSRLEKYARHLKMIDEALKILHGVIV